tara:strand:+ start:531 stop:815 length:285 start_codon:yes stop_codon:yes gene_type:complete
MGKLGDKIKAVNQKRLANKDLRKGIKELESEGVLTKDESKNLKKGGSSMADEKYKPHMMYKDCKEIKAETMEQHLKLKKKGYNHKKSKKCNKEQ